jgi:acyl-CoA thioesterase-1
MLIPLLLISDQLLAQTVELSSLPNTQSTATTTLPEKRLLVLGDSLSAAYGLLQDQGWVSLLQNTWHNEGLKIEVINAAISGETTDGGLARLPRLLTQHQPTHILIELGGNDGLQGHSVVKMRNNLARIVEIAKTSGASVFIQDMQIPTNFGKRYTQLFANTFDKIAAEYGIPLIPFFLQDVALNENLMQNDGIHPNADGQPIIADYMYQQLTPLLTESIQ